MKFGSIANDTMASVGVWMICMAGYPFDFTYAIGYPFMLPIMVGLALLSILLIKKSADGKICVRGSFFSLYLTLILFWAIQMAIRGDISYVSNIFQVVCIAIIYFSIINFIGIETISRQFVYFMVANCLGGTIVMLLLLIHDFPPLFQFTQHDGRTGSFYYLTFTNTYFEAAGFTVIRYSGMFDEPGTLSYGCMFALMINKLLMKNKKIEMLLLILPVFTFSLAHFVTALIYILLFYWRKTKLMIAMAIFMLSAFVLLESTKDTEYNRIYLLTLDRLKEDDSGGIKGNNRADLSELAVDYFKENPIIGKGKKYFEDRNMEGRIGGIFFYGALYGIVGYFFIYILLYYDILFLLVNHRKMNAWIDGLKCCIIIIANLFQRPSMTGIFPLFVLTIFSLSVLNMCNIKKNEYSRLSSIHSNYSLPQ